MTREEAIAVLAESKRQNEVMRDNPSTFWASHQMVDGVKNAERRIEAFDIALSALRPVSREQVEALRGEWIDKPTGSYGRWQTWCSACGKHSGIGGIKSNRHSSFCPNCGTPMTDEAVQMVMERMEALNEED